MHIVRKAYSTWINVCLVHCAGAVMYLRMCKKGFTSIQLDRYLLRGKLKDAQREYSICNFPIVQSQKHLSHRFTVPGRMDTLATRSQASAISSTSAWMVNSIWLPVRLDWSSIPRRAYVAGRTRWASLAASRRMSSTLSAPRWTRASQWHIPATPIPTIASSSTSASMEICPGETDANWDRSSTRRRRPVTGHARCQIGKL